MQKPFLKWAGGKASVLPQLLPLLPEGKRLIEPFVGSGVVFLNAPFENALLCDTNADLIGVYRQLQENPADFIAGCRALFTPENNTETAYYALRDTFNTTQDAVLKAQVFVYLNRHGYNGLCRYNRKGHFNVPFGRYKQPGFPEAAMLAFIEKARAATFLVQDFEATFAMAQVGDVIYCDPPYVPLSSSASFTSYHTGGFGPEDQARLVFAIESAARRGIPVVVSNHETPETLALYTHAKQVIRFDVRRSISCDIANRKSAQELLAVY